MIKNNAYLFAAEVDRQIEELSASDEIRHRNRGKILQEEILPVSRLALHLKQPGLEIEVETFEDKGEADGRIRITGFRKEEFNVQVTYAFTHEESLRREFLISKGYVPGAGEIYRDKKSRQTVANVAAVDVDEHITHVFQSVIELFQKKITKPYNENTVLIIAFENIRLYGYRNWCQLFAVLERENNLLGSKFKAIYLFNTATNELQRAA